MNKEDEDEKEGVRLSTITTPLISNVQSHQQMRSTTKTSDATPPAITTILPRPNESQSRAVANHSPPPRGSLLVNPSAATTDYLESGSSDGFHSYVTALEEEDLFSKDESFDYSRESSLSPADGAPTIHREAAATTASSGWYPTLEPVHSSDVLDVLPATPGSPLAETATGDFLYHREAAIEENLDASVAQQSISTVAMGNTAVPSSALEAAMSSSPLTVGASIEPQPQATQMGGLASSPGDATELAPAMEGGDKFDVSKAAGDSDSNVKDKDEPQAVEAPFEEGIQSPHPAKAAGESDSTVKDEDEPQAVEAPFEEGIQGPYPAVDRTDQSASESDEEHRQGTQSLNRHRGEGTIDSVDQADDSIFPAGVPLEKSLPVHEKLAGDLSVVMEDAAVNSADTVEEAPRGSVSGLMVVVEAGAVTTTKSESSPSSSRQPFRRSPRSSPENTLMCSAAETFCDLCPGSASKKAISAGFETSTNDPSGSTEREDEPREMSPLSSQPLAGSPNANEIFRSQGKPKALEVEFPSLLDSGLKKSDVVSLSSASSTISHASTARGLLSGTGMVSPGNADEVAKRRSLPELLPPRFPKRDDSLSRKSFVDSVSKKLTDQDAETEEGENVETKWIKQPKATSFNPKKSIFAAGLHEHKDEEMSPPGSPPEPVYPGFDDDSSASTDSQEEATGFAYSFAPEATTWDMIIKTDVLATPDDRSRPAVVGVLSHPEGALSEDGVTESSNATLSESETGKSSRRYSNPSLSRNREGMIKMRSFSSFGSQGRHRRSRLSRPVGILSVKSDSHRFLLSKRTEDLEVTSISSFPSQQPMSPGIGLSSKHSSSPNLGKLAVDKDKSEETLSSPMKLLSKEGFADSPKRRNIVGQLLIADSNANENLSPDSLADRYERCSSMEPTEPANEGSLLEEELLAFSSFQRIDLPFRYSKSFDGLNYLGYVRWRQMVACWKHSEMTWAMTAQDLSPHIEGGVAEEETDGELWSSSSALYRGIPIADLRLNGVALDENQARTGLHIRENTIASIPPYLNEIGQERSSEKSEACMCHNLSKSNATIEDLVCAAESAKAAFTVLIEGIAAFASRNCRTSNAIRFSVDVKDQQVAEQKASRKYSGDHLRVKDILRAQLCFPEEGALVCGLCYLLESGKLPTESGDSESDEKFELSRIKNLFGKEFPLENWAPSPLPTGYRHIIVNVRFSSGLLAGMSLGSGFLSCSLVALLTPVYPFISIAEIQFNLSSMFDVLGEEGYCLHRDLIDVANVLTTEDSSGEDAGSFKMSDIIQEAIAEFSTESTENTLFEALKSTPAGSGSRDGMTPPLSVPNDAMDTAAENGSPESVEGNGGGAIALGPEEGTQTPSTPTRASNPSVSDKGMCDMETPKAGRSAVMETKGDAAVSRSRSLKELSQHKDDVQVGDEFLAVLEYGSSVASSNPRDVATFYCLYLLFSYLIKREDGKNLATLGFGVECADDLSEHCRRCLLRCLKISNQALSIGMTGWLEYGSSGPLDRLTGLPFVVLRNIAYDFARRKKWEDAQCVLSALVVRCEQQLPLHHPTTLSSMLDLAISSTMLCRSELAERLLSRAAERLSTYLAETESQYLSHIAKSRSGKPRDTLFSVEKGRESLFKLQTFVSLFQFQLCRDITSLTDHDDEIILVNHCFLADSLAVLANCIAAARSTLGSTTEAARRRGDHYWRLAFAHYQRAFDGFAKTKGLGDPSVSRAAYGIARCLREFGETEKALELLTLVVSFSKPVPEEETKESAVEARKDETKEPTAPSFLPRSLFIRSQMVSNGVRGNKDTSAALCLWLMAILSLDQSPNEEGRERAFSYLHAASVSLQTALNKVSDADDEETKEMCVGFLAMIEDEAMQISEPMYE